MPKKINFYLILESLLTLNFRYSVSSFNGSMNGSIVISNLNPAFVKTSGLTSYWPFEGNGNDMAGVNDLYAPVNVAFVSDRKNRPFGAANFSGGVYSLPPDVYFSTTHFSLLTWIYPRSTILRTPLLDLRYPADGWGVDELIFYYRNENGKPSFWYLKENNLAIEFIASKTLTLDKWQHLAFVSDFPQFYFYIDGVKVGQGKYDRNLNLNTWRFLNWIGTTNYDGDEMANAIIDEIKIFNRSLSLEELKFEMDNEMFI